MKVFMLGNRHVGKNLRILLINNGKGTEFRHTSHPAGDFGEAADSFIAAAGLFGQKSPKLVKNYAENLGFEYFQANSKESFEAASERFLMSQVADKSILLEVFTDSDDESGALELLRRIEVGAKGKTKRFAKQILGKKSINVLKEVIKR